MLRRLFEIQRLLEDRPWNPRVYSNLADRVMKVLRDFSSLTVAKTAVATHANDGARNVTVQSTDNSHT